VSAPADANDVTLLTLAVCLTYRNNALINGR